MKKRIFALGLALTLTLSLTPAMAAGTADKFPAKNTYSGFADVAGNHWSAAPIQICYETDLMKGKSAGFDPEGPVTIAEAISVAARVGATLRGETIPASTDGTWYGGAVAYLKGLPGGDSISSMENLSEKKVSRWGFFRYLSIAVPETELAVKNAITSLPDEDDLSVLRFYNAGILTGVNAYGTFAGKKGLSRAEMAAMVSRVARPETALAFTPAAKNAHDDAFDPADYYAGIKSSTLAITGKVFSVTIGDYLEDYVASVQTLVALCDKQGVPFSWNLTLSDGTSFSDYATMLATDACLTSLWETAVGDDKLDVSDRLGAKHILVEQEQDAKALRAQLAAAGDSEKAFDELMAQLKSNPSVALEVAGYTFGPGDMVAEFENGTKALKIGEISQPIKTQFGWHIILRTEPDISVLKENAISAWLKTQELYYTSEFQNFDFPAFYDNYTADLK